MSGTLLSASRMLWAARDWRRGISALHTGENAKLIVAQCRSILILCALDGSMSLPGIVTRCGVLTLRLAAHVPLGHSAGLL
jgi:hypothetical protein